MIQNAEIGANFILLDALRKEKERLLTISNHIPCLNTKINHLSCSLQQRSAHIKLKSSSNQRYLAEAVSQFEQLFRKKSNLLKQVEGSLVDLRSRTRKAKEIRSEIQEEKRYACEHLRPAEEALDCKLREIDEQIGSSAEKMAELLAEAQHYRLEREVGRKRCNENLNDYLVKTGELKSLQKQISEVKNEILKESGLLREIEQREKESENKIYQIKVAVLEKMHEQQQIALEVGALKRKLSQIQSRKSDLINLSLKKSAEELKQTLDRKVEVCTQVSEDIAMRKVKASSAMRSNRIMEHKVQCIQLLIDQLCCSQDQLLKCSADKEALAKVQQLKANKHNE